MTLSRALLAVLALWLCSSSFSNAQTSAPEGTEYIQDSVDFSFGSETWDPPDSVNELSIGDDGRASVPLDFAFPLGQRLYTQSWMHSNGVVTFMSTFNWMCCNGLDLENYSWNQTNEPYFNHMIAPLWTDTINTNVDIDGDGIDDSGHYTESYEYDDGTQSQRYFWRNVAEYYNNNALNSFALEIYDDGQVDIWHFEVDIRNHDIFVGAVQDFQNDDTPVNGILYHNRQTGDYTFTATDADDALIYSGTPFDIYPSQCTNNPLYSSDCPGYSAAYLAAQCAASPLYDTSCDGYAEAYAQFEYDRQCTANPLYDAGCPGYQQAYYDQQCSLDPLYDSGCPGYAEAYYDQQCAADPLYDTGCPGYATAYYDQQCSLDPLYDSGCPGYATAYYDQQCTLDGLYDTGCPNYETAYNANQCSLNPLYLPSCSGYAAALAEQEAAEQTTVVVVIEEDYSEPQILDDTVVNDLIFNEPESVTYEIEIETPPIEIVQPMPQTIEIVEPVSQEESIENQIELEFNTIESEPAEEPAPVEIIEVVEEPIEEPIEEVEVVEEVIEEEPVEDEPIEEVVEDEPSEDEEPVEEVVEESTEEDVEEEVVEEEVEEESTEVAEAEEEVEKEQPKKETKNDKKKKLARKRAASLAEMMSEAATLEQQQMIQNQIFALVNYNPDFLGYATGMPDVTGYPVTQLPDGTINENQRGLRNGLAQELLHEKMVASQWER